MSLPLFYDVTNLLYYDVTTTSFMTSLDHYDVTNALVPSFMTSLDHYDVTGALRYTATEQLLLGMMTV